MGNEREQRIRERAHEIWEREGRPDGRAQQHWDLASQEIDGEEERLTGRSERPDKTGAERAPTVDRDSDEGRQAAQTAPKTNGRESRNNYTGAPADKSRA
jgi:hypothetical protein